MRENFRRDDIKFFKGLIELGGGSDFVPMEEIVTKTNLSFQKIGGISQRYAVYVEKKVNRKNRRMMYRLTRQGVEQMIKQGWVIVVPLR